MMQIVLVSYLFTCLIESDCVSERIWSLFLVGSKKDDTASLAVKNSSRILSLLNWALRVYSLTVIPSSLLIRLLNIESICQF